MYQVLKQFKSKVDKLDIRKLEITPIDLSKVSDVVKMMLFKKIYIVLRY